MERDRTISWLSNKLKTEKIILGILVLIRTAISLISVYYAFLFKNLIEAAVNYNNDLFSSTIKILVCCLLIQVILQAINRNLTEYTAVSIENKLKESFYSGLIIKRYDEIKGTHSGEWLNYIIQDTRLIANNIVDLIPGGLSMLVRAISIVIMMIYLDISFALVIIPLAVISFVFTLVIRNRMKELHKGVQTATGKLHAFLQEQLENIITVKAYSKETYSIMNMDILSDTVKKKRMERIRYSSVLFMGYSLFINGLYIMAAIYCSYSILHKSISIGSTVALLQLVSQIQTPFSNMSSYVTKYYALTASTERLMTIDSLQDELTEKTEGLSEIFNRTNSIVFENVSFSYEDDEESVVLSGVDLCFEKNSFIAVIGESGCGKSTILKLLLYLYEPDSGCILLRTDNGDIKLSGSFRELFAYVPQKLEMFDGNIRETVIYGEEYNSDKMNQALYISDSADFINGLPEKDMTVLGEKGFGLSEGQQQRLSIARAVYSERPVILLDEATSALDNETTNRVITRLKEMGNKTIICVTHDMSIAEEADKTVFCRKEGDKTIWNEKM